MWAYITVFGIKTSKWCDSMSQLRPCTMSKSVCKYGIYKCIISVKNWVRLKVLSTKLKAENVYHTVSTITV